MFGSLFLSGNLVVLYHWSSFMCLVSPVLCSFSFVEMPLLVLCRVSSALCSLCVDALFVSVMS